MTTPDGREWSLRVKRMRMPAWHHSKYEPWDDADGGLVGVLFAFLVMAPLMWIVLPLVWAVMQVPFAVARSLVSNTRWIVAVTEFPAPLKLIWKTSKGDAAEAAAQIAQKLSQGYEGLTLPTAELVFVSRPAGVDDVSR